MRSLYKLICSLLPIDALAKFMSYTIYEERNEYNYGRLAS